MKTAKSCKFIILLTATVLSFIVAIALMTGSVRSASALTVSKTDAGTSFSGGQSVSFDGTDLVATVKEGDTFKFSNKLVINDFETQFVLDDAITSFEIALKSGSYFAFGNYDSANDCYDKEIVNTVKLDATNDKVFLNGVEYSATVDGTVKIGFSVSDNFLSVSVGGTSVATESNAYYKIAGRDLCFAEISISKFANTDAKPLKINYIDQKVSDGTGAYKQTFVLDGNNVKDLALPRIAISDSYMSDYGVYNFVKGKKYTMPTSAYAVYSVLKTDVTTGGLYVAKADENNNIWLSNEDYPSSFAFYGANGTLTEPTSFIIRDTNHEKIEERVITLIETEDDTTAPLYKDNADRSFIKEIEDTVKGKIHSADGKFVRLGETITIPSDKFKDIVLDDTTKFADLKHTLYYRTPTLYSSTTGWSFTLDAAGDYLFYVVFEDASGNKMDSEKFYTDDDGTITYGEYEKYIFRFSVEDNAPISVKTVGTQGKGYLNTEYVFSEFDVEASGYTPTYKLLFRENADKEWTEIESASSVKEDTYESEVFTFEDIKGFNYDGKLTFTPVKKGQYKVNCTVSSTKSTREASADSSIVEITDKQTTIKVDTHWVQNNVWSIVFLSVGAVCLVAILILLFVKPKETVIEEDDE